LHHATRRTFFVSQQQQQFSRGIAKLCRKKAGRGMFLILAVVLVLMWIGGLVMFKTAGLLIHLLLLFAIISIVMHFVGRRSAA
jgi:hypothetical protein